MKNSRRLFIKQSALAGAGIFAAKAGFSAKSYNRIMGSNDRVRVGVVGFSDRHKSSHAPSFMNHYKDLNFEIVAVSDIWKEKMQHDVTACRNNDEMYSKKLVDAVFLSTADFQHALHTVEVVKYGWDAYVEKPFAETMEDARAALKAVKALSLI